MASTGAGYLTPDKWKGKDMTDITPRKTYTDPSDWATPAEDDDPAWRKDPMDVTTWLGPFADRDAQPLLAEAKAFLREGFPREVRMTCPSCTRHVQLYSREIGENDCTLIARIYHLYGQTEFNTNAAVLEAFRDDPAFTRSPAHQLSLFDHLGITSRTRWVAEEDDEELQSAIRAEDWTRVKRLRKRRREERDETTFHEKTLKQGYRVITDHGTRWLNGIEKAKVKVWMFDNKVSMIDTEEKYFHESGRKLDLDKVIGTTWAMKHPPKTGATS